MEETIPSPSESPLAPAARQIGARIRGDHLRGARLALAVQAGQAGLGDAGDDDVAQRPDRERAHDRLGRQLLAAGQRDADAARGDVDRAHAGAEPQPFAQVGGQPQRQGRAAGREPQPLPVLVAVDLVAAGRADDAQHREQRPALARPGGERERPELVQAHDGRARALGPQPVREREAVERRGLRMAPRVGRVDGAREPTQAASIRWASATSAGVKNGGHSPCAGPSARSQLISPGSAT